MITLSEFLGTIPCAGNAADSVKIAIREAKRLEALDVPRVEAERKPIVDDGGENFYFVVDARGVLITAWRFSREDAEGDAKRIATKTGQPHTVCQVMAPESGECPTVPVVTYTPTPERSHEWAICSETCEYRGRWYATHRRGDGYWAYDLPSKDIQRFPTSTEAQTYIDTHKIADAYPWPVPKLTSSQ